MSEFIVNSFQVPNALVDKLMDEMSGNALKCLMLIIRQTRGWHKESDKLALSKFVKKGMSENTARTALRELQTLGLIRVIDPVFNNGIKAYSLTNLFDSGEVLSSEAAGAKIEPLKNCTSEIEATPSKVEHQTPSKIEPTKDILFKDTIQKTLNISFDAFWKLYDKCVDKKPCEAKWSKLKDSERQQAIAHLPKYIESTPDKTFRKNPQTYLNQKSWNNEIIPSGARSSGSAGQAQQDQSTRQTETPPPTTVGSFAGMHLVLFKQIQKVRPELTQRDVIYLAEQAGRDVYVHLVEMKKELETAA